MSLSAAEKTVLVVMGTRPEAIKLAPVILALKSFCSKLNVKICITAQHRELLDEVLEIFRLVPDADLDIMTRNQSLVKLLERLVPALDACFERFAPDFVLVQGDTTSALLAAQVAFFRRIPVGHVEAGLRTNDIENPFPEEANRRAITSFAKLHFAPTRQAVENLRRQGIPDENVILTGNTVVDALHWILNNHTPEQAHNNRGPMGKAKTVLVTAHRRESFGVPLENICHAIRKASETFPLVRFLFPVHPNPIVKECVERLLGGIPRVNLLPPQSYADFVGMLATCDVVMTDSGGVQEEAPSFEKPVLVLREVTERPELIAGGYGTIVGTDGDSILAALRNVLSVDRHALPAARGNPFGDGRAAARICSSLCRFLEIEMPPKDRNCP